MAVNPAPRGPPEPHSAAGDHDPEKPWVATLPCHAHMIDQCRGIRHELLDPHLLRTLHPLLAEYGVIDDGPLV